MEENVNVQEETEQITEPIHIPRNTKQQSALYTIISIALFCVIYFGGKELLNVINRPYYMVQHNNNNNNLNSELLEMQYDYASIFQECGVKYENSRIEKNEDGYMLSILFSGINDIVEFTESGILFEYGNAVEDVENEFYIYENSILSSEYVIATKYVNNDNPNNEILVFEYEDKIYAEFHEYGTFIPTEVKILFDGCEKVY